MIIIKIVLLYKKYFKKYFYMFKIFNFYGWKSKLTVDNKKLL